MKIYTKESLIDELNKIRNMGWIPNARHGNHGGIGNTLEDLLGISENNLPIPNAAEWELKTSAFDSASLTTLFHMEPSPRAIRFVPKILLPYYGWTHQEAGGRYSVNELSFRQTISGSFISDRGFTVLPDRATQRVLISFDSAKVDSRHDDWLNSVECRIGLGQLIPQPYWGIDDLYSKARTKLLNCFYVQAKKKREDGKELYWYDKIMMLQKFDCEKFLLAIENGNIYVDFDARTGHNHGTKFRMKQNALPTLYEKVTEII